MQVPEQVLAARMPSGAKTVLSAMWRAAEDEPPWIPALQRELAQASGLSVRQVRHWIGYLREQGWIREEARELLGRTFAGHGLARTTPLHQRRPASSATAGDRRTRSAKREKTHRSEGDRIAADLAQIAKHARAGDSAEVILERLRKARAPCSDPAIAEVDGTVQHAGDGVVVVAPKNGEPRTYKVSKGRQLRVAEGDRVRAGEQLVVGEWHRGQGVPPRRPHGGEHEAAGQGSGRGRHRRPMEEDAGGLRRHHAHGPQDCGDGRQRRPTRRTRSGARSFLGRRRLPPIGERRQTTTPRSPTSTRACATWLSRSTRCCSIPRTSTSTRPSSSRCSRGCCGPSASGLPLITRESTGVLEAGEGRLLAGRALGWRYMAVLPCADDLLAARMLRPRRQPQRRAGLPRRGGARRAAAHAPRPGRRRGDHRLGRRRPRRAAGRARRGRRSCRSPTPEEPPAVPWTQPGDLFEIGPHRLVCGDSTDPAVVERLMQGEKAALVVTDPPYGVKYVGKSEDLAADRGRSPTTTSASTAPATWSRARRGRGRCGRAASGTSARRAGTWRPPSASASSTLASACGQRSRG
jgi:hypothetical protein